MKSKLIMKKKEEIPEMPKTLSTYLGPKGYTILKSELDETQIRFIKETLTIRPFTPGMTLSASVSFPAFRESPKKIYVPRFFGAAQFGPAKENKIPEGDNIEVPFVGTLRDYQEDVVDAYKKSDSGGLITLGCGQGKTVIGLNIISTMKKKTLIIVHKEFLLNQWVERIHQYLPTARVGKIQGQIIDIEDKDIVIGMLQSLSMKDYADSIFSSFGMLLIDEVHHIGSEVFSCSLFKIVTKYTLGLSATMDRKDGTTFVFKMFLGDIIYRMTNKTQRFVQVRQIGFESNDPDFEKVHYDFRGNPAFSTMISKLCDYAPRTEFIIRIIRDMFLENPTQQIMVIAHNRNVLTYIHDAIFERKIATVGYYVGGMKESALKKTEDQQVVVCTFSMAAEALDIKSLCTLIMVTPKTDVEQTVGRILRSDHERPVVVDIVDTHDLFQKQWAKRKTFYKKENYEIIKTTSSKYNPDISRWDNVFKPKCETETRKNKITKTIVEKDDEDDDGEVLTASLKSPSGLSHSGLSQGTDTCVNDKMCKKQCIIDLSMFT
jgi:superfamily II DNA or RNA helicase